MNKADDTQVSRCDQCDGSGITKGHGCRSEADCVYTCPVPVPCPCDGPHQSGARTMTENNGGTMTDMTTDAEELPEMQMQIDRDLHVAQRELKSRRLWAKQNDALLRLICNTAGLATHTCYRVEPETSHPEDDIRWMVETGNGSGEFVLVKYGFDSDVAKLMNLLECSRNAEAKSPVVRS